MLQPYNAFTKVSIRTQKLIIQKNQNNKKTVKKSGRKMFRKLTKNEWVSVKKKRAREKNRENKQQNGFTGTFEFHRKKNCHM